MYVSFIQVVAAVSFISSAKAVSLAPESQVNTYVGARSAIVESKDGSPIHRRDIGGTCSSDYDYWTLTCPVDPDRDNCHAGYHANAFYQDGQCNCVCEQNNSRRRSIEANPYHKQEDIVAAKAVKFRDSTLNHRRDIGGSCSSDYDYWTLTCPVDSSSDNCLAGYHANAFYQDEQCNCVCVQNTSRRRSIKRETLVAAKTVEFRDGSQIHRRDIGGSCSSDYDFWTLSCPVDSDNCLAGYHAHAFYHDEQCNCVCVENGSRRRGIEANPFKREEKKVTENKVGIGRRDIGGSCSSDYDYWTLTCPVDSDNCLAGYHANAFYHDEQCNCVCVKNGSRRRGIEANPIKREENKVAENKIGIGRRDIGGSCSSDYDYWTLTCPVDSKHDNCHAGYHANAFYQDGQCNCVCEQNGSRRRGIDANPIKREENKVAEYKIGIERRDIGGSCSSNYDYWTLTCPVDSDNCLAGYHTHAFYHDEQCNCVCVKNGSRRRGIDEKPIKREEKKITKDKIGVERRDIGGSCSSDYDYWTFTCPVDSHHDNCHTGYHANAFYQDGQCNCVCDQN